jgi:hypothetical protein
LLDKSEGGRWVQKGERLRRIGLALMGATACMTLAAGGVALASADAPGARAARALNVKDEGHLHLAGRPSGSAIVEEGTVTGTLPGTVKVRFNVGATVTASFTIYPRGGGSISGHGSGALHSTSVYATFGGSLAVTGGTGRYRHAHGHGGLYGAINRHTYAVTVQTVGTLSY